MKTRKITAWLLVIAMIAVMIPAMAMSVGASSGHGTIDYADETLEFSAPSNGAVAAYSLRFVQANAARARWFPVYSADNKIDISRFIPRRLGQTYTIGLKHTDGSVSSVTLNARPQALARDAIKYNPITNKITGPTNAEVKFDIGGWVNLNSTDPDFINTAGEIDAYASNFPTGATGLARVRAVDGVSWASATTRFRIPAQPRAPKAPTVRADRDGVFFLNGANDKMEYTVFANVAAYEAAVLNYAALEGKVWNALSRNTKLSDLVGVNGTTDKLAVDNIILFRIAATDRRPASAIATYAITAADIPAVRATAIPSRSSVTEAGTFEIKITLTNGTFADTISGGNFILVGDTGLSVAGAVRDSNTEATITVTVAGVTDGTNLVHITIANNAVLNSVGARTAIESIPCAVVIAELS